MVCCIRLGCCGGFVSRTGSLRVPMPHKLSMDEKNISGPQPFRTSTVYCQAMPFGLKTICQ